MKKNMLALIVPIVLVIGTAFGAGIAVGYPCEDETDVEVEVEYVPPELDLCNAWLECQSENGEMPYDVGCTDDIVIRGMKVYSPHHEEVEVYLEIESDDYSDGEEGDAVREKAIENTITVYPGQYDNGVATFDYNSADNGGFNLPDGEPFWVAGRWTLRGHLYVDDEKVEDSEDEKTGFFEVEKCCGLEVTDSLSATGEDALEPDNTFELDGDITTLYANYAWELSADDFTLSSTETADTLTGEVLYGEDYDQDTLSGAPVYEFEAEDDAVFQIRVHVEFGTDAGTYNGEALHVLAEP